MSILKDVSVGELLHMREDEGMSNQQIADSLDVSYKTILRLIGKQPPQVRGNRRYSIPKTNGVVRAVNEDAHDSADAESKPACLVVEDRTVVLKGIFASYEIPVRKKRIEIDCCECGSVQVPFDKLDDFVAELQAISRNMAQLRVENEMW